MEDKKDKIGKLKFYKITDKYIEYLNQFDKKVAYNKKEKRPYIGIILNVEENNYFAPLFSPKDSHKAYRDNLSFFKIVNSKTKNNLGIIRFSCMLPVPKEQAILVDVKEKSYAYKRLLSEQYSYINMTVNKEKIIYKAERIYSIVTGNSKSKMSKFYKRLSCNFKLLEEKCNNYNAILL